MIWYGLKVDGELIAVLRWRYSGRPTLFDFERSISSSVEYEIVEVEVVEVGVAP
jgi:hypothetical protein